MSNTEENVDQAPQEKKSGRRALVLFSLLALALLGGGGYAYQHYFSQRALPGTSIAGESVSGMNKESIAKRVAQRAEAAKLRVVGPDSEATLSLSEAGVEVDPQATAAAALRPDASLWERFTSFFSPVDLKPVVKLDPDTGEQVSSRVFKSPGLLRDAKVEYSGEKNRFVAVPGRAGKGVDQKHFADQLQASAATLANSEISVSLTEREPAISDDAAKAAAKEANGLLDQEFSVKVPHRDKPLRPERRQLASWFSFVPADGALKTVPVKEEIDEWLNSVSKRVHRKAVDGLRNVDASGTTRATPREKQDGEELSNREELFTGLNAAVADGKSFRGEAKVDVSPAKWVTRQVAPGAENLPYAAAEGEKWLEIDLSNHTYRAWIGAQQVRGPILMVSGAPATPTVTGTYSIYLKYDSQTMRGKNADGTSYETPDVPWVSYWHRGYAFHGAPWRGSFGYSGEQGSHGCVNLPVSEAKWIYDWAPIGTPVVSHAGR
ncbi:L,D-transpeptidase family protein [Dermabacteraceae bacterium P13136]